MSSSRLFGLSAPGTFAVTSCSRVHTFRTLSGHSSTSCCLASLRQATPSAVFGGAFAVLRYVFQVTVLDSRTPGQPGWAVSCTCLDTATRCSGDSCCIASDFISLLTNVDSSKVASIHHGHVWTADAF
jgi:hypothetical protein